MAPSGLIRKSAVRLFLFVIAALIASPVMAAPPAAGPGQGPCADDVAKFCKDVQPGGGRILHCMKEHENDLSPACKQHIAAVKERVKEAQAACHDDVMRFCKDVKPGGGRIINCLKEHANELSPECKSKMESRKGQK
jgi:hypothetical protein